MSEVVQTILLGDPSGRPGNCLQAAVASLLDLDLEDVPHFAESDGDWEAEFEAWVQTAGYRIVWRGPQDTPPAFGLAFGFTTRSGERHAVVYRDGAMAWDPHPSRDGLTSVLTYLEFEAREKLTPRHPRGWYCQHTSITSSHLVGIPTVGCGCAMLPLAG